MLALHLPTLWSFAYMSWSNWVDQDEVGWVIVVAVCSLGKEQCCILNYVIKSWQLNRKSLQPPGGQNIDDLSQFEEGLVVACTNSSQHSPLSFQSAFQLCFLLTAQHLLSKLQSLANQPYPFLVHFFQNLSFLIQPHLTPAAFPICWSLTYSCQKFFSFL